MQAPFIDPLSELAQIRTTLPLQGREFAMQAIHGLLDTVALDLPLGPRAMTISGEMGVGKTRLLAALCLAARERGLRILDARAYEMSSTIPYFPFIEALRPVLRTATPEQLQRYLGLPLPTNGQPSTVAQGEQDAAMLKNPQHVTTTITFSGPSLLTTLAKLFPELAAMVRSRHPTGPLASNTLPDISPQPEPLSPDQEKFRLFDAIATLLERIADEQPVVLCIDDLHWADSASLELTLYLTIRLRSSRIVLIGATRPPTVTGARNRYASMLGEDAPLISAAARAGARALSDLVRHGMLLLLPIGPLSTEAAAAHLQKLLPGTIPPDVAQTILDRAEGNPFFLEELIRTLTLHQHLTLRDGVWHATRIHNMKLPESIVLAVAQRLSGLSNSCRDLLHIAAHFGRTFPIDALAQAVGKNIDQVQPLAEEACAASVIAPVATSQHHYIFCQGIVQEVLQEALPVHRASIIHSAIGRALEASYADEAREHAAELARHYALSGEKEATLRWTVLAGEYAARQQAHREAIGHFRLALKLIESLESASIYTASTQPSVPSVAELYLTIGELWFMLGELEQAANALQQALQHLQHNPTVSSLLLAHTNRLLADVYRIQTQYDQALAHLQIAQAAFSEASIAATDTVSTGNQQITHVSWSGRNLTHSAVALSQPPISATEHIHLLQSQATLHVLLNQPKEAERLLWQSHHLATEIADRSSQAFALHWVGYLRGWGEQIQEAIRLQKQAHDLYLAIGDPFRATLGAQALGIVYQALGDMEQARFYNTRGLELAHRYGVQRILGWLSWNQGMMALAQGDWENCTSYLQEAAQEATIHNDARLRPMALLAQAEFHFRHGDWPAAEQLFQDSLQAATTTEWLPSVTALYGHFLAVTGRLALARGQLDRAAEMPEPPGIGGNFYLPFLAEGYLHLNQVERAAAYSERIRNLHDFFYFGSSVDRILGVLAAYTGDWATAEHAFAAGLLLCRRSGNQPEEAYILYEQARAALMQNAPLQRIHELCEQASTLFSQYAMQRALTMVDALRDGADQLNTQHRQKAVTSSPTASAVRPTEYVLEQHLTRRELDVLRLVAEGHTDREVADTLIISPRTVNRHLSNIFIKLDMPGRAAAVAYAIRHGLV